MQPVFCKIIPEAACDKIIFEHLPCSQRGDGTREHRPITEKESKEILRMVLVSILILVSNFIEAKKLIIV
jgi:hypothetical protein